MPRLQPAGSAPDCVHEEHRQKHERQVVDDVVEPRAIEPRQPLLDPDGPCQPPVGGIDDRRATHPQERLAVVAGEDRERAEERGERAGGSVEVDEPGREKVHALAGRGWLV